MTCTGGLYDKISCNFRILTKIHKYIVVVLFWYEIIKTHSQRKGYSINIESLVIQGGARKTGPPSRRPTWA